MVSSRRTAILRAALVVFLQHGLGAARIEDVSVHSGASVGSIYHHFGGKEALAGAVFVDALTDYQTMFLAELGRYEDAGAGVRAMVLAHLRWCLHDEPGFGRFLLLCGDAARAGALTELRERNQVFFGEVRSWVRPHVAGGTIRDLPSTVLYSLWFGAAQEYCRLSITGRLGNADADADAGVGQALADGAWRALGTAESRPAEFRTREGK